jgi:homoserine O-acetyltransferase
MIGPGKAFDTNKYFMICSNVLGGCRGTTGPGSVNPATGRAYAMSFPVITIGDMVRVQRMLIDWFGIARLLSVVGGSMGGMQALEWAVSYPDRVVSAIPIACTTRHSAQQIAFNEVGRQAIMADPDWNNGEYYDGKPSYLRYRGSEFVTRFDADSYLYITKALDYFDLTNGHGSLAAAFERTEARFLVISFSSDWLYPSYQSQEIVRALRARNCDVAYVELESNYGHDAFLVDVAEQTDLIRGFLASTVEKAS